MKKVIFVSGTAYSGTTFMHFILANDPKGMAVGEAHNFFRPTRRGHYQLTCSCGNQNCSVWESHNRAGEEVFYSRLFNKFPDIDFIVDSSKNPRWISEQTAILQAQDIAVGNILIWKTPQELAKSFQKRGNLHGWERAWVNYHRNYAAYVSEWSSVKYKELIDSRQVLIAACNYLDIDYFDGKERYWQKVHHAVGGNPSARVHLFDSKSEDFQRNVERSNSEIDVIEKGTHQSIYYDSTLDFSAKRAVADREQKNKYIVEIQNMLNSRDLINPSKDSVDFSSIGFPEYSLQLRRIKHELVQMFEYWRQRAKV